MESMDIQPYVDPNNLNLNPYDLGKLSFKHLINKNQVRNTRTHELLHLYFNTFV